MEGMATWRFHIVGCDEGHLVKTLAAKGSLSLQWLGASKHFFISATPMPNGIDDFRGYMLFIEPWKADQWWSERNLTEWNFAADANPYDLPDDHPATKIQLTSAAVKDWIFTYRIDPATKGAHLAKLWKRVLLRRTFSSRVPFHHGKNIGAQLPRVQAALINFTHTPDD